MRHGFLIWCFQVCGTENAGNLNLIVSIELEILNVQKYILNKDKRFELYILSIRL